MFARILARESPELVTHEKRVWQEAKCSNLKSQIVSRMALQRCNVNFLPDFWVGFGKVNFGR